MVGHRLQWGVRETIDNGRAPAVLGGVRETIVNGRAPAAVGGVRETTANGRNPGTTWCNCCCDSRVVVRCNGSGSSLGKP